jgi:hypothetical protein
MKIDSYSFGSMIVNGKIYNQDLIVFPDKIISSWWRQEGHFLKVEDLDEVLSYKPEILVVGTGASGVMKISESVREKLKKSSITLIDLNTSQAYKVFNGKIAEGKKVAGAFHLTC